MLASDPAFGLAGNSQIKSLSSQIVPAVGATPSYCRLDFTYSALSGPSAGYDVGQAQQIKIRVGLPLNFSIYDAADQTRVVKEALKTLEISSTNFAPAAVHATISNAKNQLISAEDYARVSGDFYSKQVARVYTKYQQLLTSNNALDFDDLLLKTAQAFRAHPEILKELQERFA